MVIDVIVILSSQLKAARALLGWSQEELAKKARISDGTVRRMESFEGAARARSETLRLIVAILERAGIEFLNEEKPGVRLVKKKRR